MLANTVLLAGRVLIGFYFFSFFFWNYYHRSAALEVIRNQALPFPTLLFSIGLVMQFCTGLLVIFATYLLQAAAILIVFDFLATFIFHRFWTMPVGPVRTLNTIIFIGNLTVTLGGLLLLVGLAL